MDFKEKWEILDTLGEGGQGKVFRVIPKSMGDPVDREILRAIADMANQFNSDDHRRKVYTIFHKNLLTLLERESPSNQKALKVLHKPADARDFELAEERIRQEIKAMSETTHPNLLKIIDHDLDSKWFVSEFYPKGSVSKSKNQSFFAGDFAKALKAFRPLVEGVARATQKKSSSP